MSPRPSVPPTVSHPDVVTRVCEKEPKAAVGVILKPGGVVGKQGVLQVDNGPGTWKEGDGGRQAGSGVSARRALLRPQGSCVPELPLVGSPLNGRSDSASRPLGTSQGRPVPRRRAGLEPEAGTRRSARLCVCPGSARGDTGTIASHRIPRPVPAGGRASKWTRTGSFCSPGPGLCPRTPWNPRIRSASP